MSYEAFAPLFGYSMVMFLVSALVMWVEAIAYLRRKRFVITIEPLTDVVTDTSSWRRRVLLIAVILFGIATIIQAAIFMMFLLIMH